MSDVEARLTELHRPVQWTGWSLWLRRLGRDPRSYMDRWCAECNRSWPCATAVALGAGDRS